MKIKAQIAMVMALDKCIGCHTCSLSCNNIWTNRPGAEYMWFNNVETKPGVGYPVEWENQKKHRGGWIAKNGRLGLRAGNRAYKIAQIFHNPDLPMIDEYYEPWTYDYDTLLISPARKHQPVARPKSLITGERMEVKWGPNWEDDLAGVHVTGQRDPCRQGIEDKVAFEFEKTFLMYLPRICEHCLNPGCVASCPSGALYKRDEDGIVLVDQEVCRGWRYCVSGCPYKKTYFNWKTQKAEKCIFCYPRIEVGTPTACSETCTGRLRFTGLLLYDADRVREVASIEDDSALYQGHLSLFLNPFDPAIINQALKDGITPDWIEAAQRSPVYKLVMQYQVALPIHPEFRTLPMVWYVPPLSPMIKELTAQGGNPNEIFPTVEQMRIPVDYLANLLTGGNRDVIVNVLQKLLTMRQYMRGINIGKGPDLTLPQTVGMTKEEMEGMYRLLSIAKFDERNVIPTAHREYAKKLFEEQGQVGYDHLANCEICNDYDVEANR